MPAYFYLCVRSCVCANILEILAASHCLSKENNRCVSAKRLAGWCHCDPVLGLIFLKGCSSWEGLPAWAQGVNLNGAAVCTLREGLCGSCPVSLKVDFSFGKQTQSLLPLSCQQCLQAEISDIPSSFSSWLLPLNWLNNPLEQYSSESLTA